MHPDFFKNPTAILLGCNIAPRFRQFGCMVNAKSGGLGATLHPKQAIMHPNHLLRLESDFVFSDFNFLITSL